MSGIADAYTLSEAQDMLRIYKECERQLVLGGAQSYKIGSREYTSLDLKEIRESIGHFANIVESKSSGANRRRVRRVIPCDR